MKQNILIIFTALLAFVLSLFLFVRDISRNFIAPSPTIFVFEWFFLPAILLFLLGLVLLIVFLRSFSNPHRRNQELLLLSLLSFCLTACVLFSAPLQLFFCINLPFHLSTISALCTVTILLIFFSLHIHRFAKLIRILQIIQVGSIALYLASPLIKADILSHCLLWVQALNTVILLIIFFISLVEWQDGNRFCQVLCLTSLFTGVGLFFAGGIPLLLLCHISDALPVVGSLDAASHSYFPHWNPISFTSGLSVLAAYVVTAFLQCHTKIKQLSERMQLTQSSYDALRTQSEEIMRIRHDMTHHLNVLYRLLEQKSLEQACAYVRNLIGQHQQIFPIMRCGHPLLDILVNAKLSAAIHAGISIQIVHAEAPPTLPLSDTELTSLIVNILSNALQSASVCPPGHRFLTLDLHTKHEFFIFSCTNSRTNAQSSRTNASVHAVPKHGYGMHIITDIVKRHHGLIQTEQQDNIFRLIFSVPLHET